MTEQVDILGGISKTNRSKRTTGRTPTFTPVTPAVTGLQPYNLPQSALGCAFPAKESLDITVTKKEKELLQAKGREVMSRLPVLVPEEILYNIMSFDELKAMAVFTVKNTNDSGVNSINDPRGGVVDNDKVCAKCGEDNFRCPGHYGMIKLNAHIIHPMLRRHVVDVLSSVCNSCGGLLLDRETLEEKGIMKLEGSKRIRAIAELSAKTRCRRPIPDDISGVGEISGCVPNPTYNPTKSVETGNIFYSYEGKSGKENIKSIEDVEKILDAISDEDAAILGFQNNSHPRRFILKALPVIPLCARAPAIQDGEVMNDDITCMYLNIVSINEKLSIVQSEKEKEETITNLTFAIQHMIDNGDTKVKQGRNRVMKDIKSRIQSKEGLIRSLIQGKRVNYSARTVLGPDPSLKFGQIRVPEAFAPYLTYPEVVGPQNLGRLTKLLQAGKITHVTPGSGPLKGTRIQVSEKQRKERNLKAGDVVDRYLQNGDYVLFNRQPTLHKQGIMGYEVVLGKQLTIGLHLAYTTPHNADFDGDEGTLHAPQSLPAREECEYVMGVKQNIMNAQDNKNIMGVVMDALTGAYLLTQPETKVDLEVRNNIISFMETPVDMVSLTTRLERYNIPLDSGNALFSALLPEDFYYKKGDVLIENGVLIRGPITKEHIGNKHGSIIQVLMKDYGQEATVNFFTDIYRMMVNWITVRGFSVGLDDCFLEGEDPQIKIKSEIKRAEMLVKSMGWKLEDPLEEERREKQIITYLDNAKAFGTKLSKENLSKYNSFNVMATSEAKGSVYNIALITGLLGQQFVMGQRMPETISGGRRCLPYFPEDSLDPQARGFCVNSFLTGLTPSEMFFHQAGTREGLTDTSVKTSDVGTMHRKMVKALEDVKVYEDGSVRNAYGHIFQFTYGEDGLDAGMLESVETRAGKFATFINVKRIAGKINQKFGYSSDK